MTTEQIESEARAQATRNERKTRHREKLFHAMALHLKDAERGRETRHQVPSAAGAATVGELRIGIVGGGVSSLYAALLLDEMGIGHHVFEASGERLGGRVLTHYFDNEPHQYAELGAMRFPHNWMQSRLFDFWSYLNETSDGVPGARDIGRIPYILFDQSKQVDSGNLLAFNGMSPATRNEVKLDNSLLGFDPQFTADKYQAFKDKNGKLKPAQALLDHAVEPFMKLLDSGSIDEAWAEVLKYDSYSARSYLEEIGDGVNSYPTRIVDYLETVLSYTGVYDLAFTEILLDNFSFDDTTEWSAMDGGTDRVTQEMVNRISPANVTMGAQVYRIEEVGERAVIHYRNGDGTLSKSEEFDRVIITVPFSVLQFIETPPSWSPEKFSAIRMLKMTNAVKVALGFRSRFWEQDGPHSTGMAGGQSNTDLPVRSVVYPSFGIGDPGPAYILGSYCWQDDADRFSHLTEEQMFETCLRHVVELHGDVARDEYLGHGASVVWNQEPLAGGGFEFFGPGQFVEKFLEAREPEGRFHFAGEHLDLVHYWIAGAYDSAFRSVWEILILEGLMSRDVMRRLRDALGGGLVLPTMIPYFGSAEVEELAGEVFAEAFEPPSSRSGATVANHVHGAPATQESVR